MRLLHILHVYGLAQLSPGDTSLRQRRSKLCWLQLLIQRSRADLLMLSNEIIKVRLMCRLPNREEEKQWMTVS